MKSLAIIGFGNMGESLISGIYKQYREDNKFALQLYVIEKDECRLALATKNYDAIDYDQAEQQGQFSHIDIVIIAVKPQDIAGICFSYKKLLHNTQVISIAAGVSLKRLGELCPSSEIIRFMPSLAASVGRAITAVSCSEGCNEAFKETALKLAESVGMAIELPENLIAAVIGISGSGIAYVYEFMHALALGGVREGLKYEQSLEATINLLEGAAAAMREAQSKGLGPTDLVSRICSPGGTTIEGIHSLHDNRFTATVMDAVAKAAARSRVLER